MLCPMKPTTAKETRFSRRGCTWNSTHGTLTSLSSCAVAAPDPGDTDAQPPASTRTGDWWTAMHHHDRRHRRLRGDRRLLLVRRLLHDHHHHHHRRLSGTEAAKPRWPRL